MDAVSQACQTKLRYRAQICTLACVCGGGDGAIEVMSPMLSKIVVGPGDVDGGPVVSARLMGGVTAGSRVGEAVVGAVMFNSDSTGGIALAIGVAASGKVAGGNVVSGRLVLGRVDGGVAGGTKTGMTPPTAARRSSCGMADIPAAGS